MYYEKLKETDQRLVIIAEWRDKKLNKLSRKYDKIMAKAAKQTAKGMEQLGMTIPQEFKENTHGSKYRDTGSNGR